MSEGRTHNELVADLKKKGIIPLTPLKEGNNEQAVF